MLIFQSFSIQCYICYTGLQRYNFFCLNQDFLKIFKIATIFYRKEPKGINPAHPKILKILVQTVLFPRCLVQIHAKHRPARVAVEVAGFLVYEYAEGDIAVGTTVSPQFFTCLYVYASQVGGSATLCINFYDFFV